MRTFIVVLWMLASIAVCAESSPEKKSASRIGVYDSRAVAVAYAGSVFCSNYIRTLQARYSAAKVAGNKEEMLKAEAEAEKHQKQLHTQAFSTAPVDDLLQHIKKYLPDIMKKAGVDIIVSRWDQKSLEKYGTAQKEDITMLLVEAFKPNARTRKMAKEIQTKKPISLKQAENIKD